MALSERDQISIRKYLLGHLSGEEQERIEDRLMTDDDLFEELEISKGELIEEYRAGELKRTEQEFFEENFLASREGRQSYTFAAALDCLEQPQSQSFNFFERLSSFFIRQRWLVATATAAAVIIIVAIVAQRSPSQTPYSIALNNSVLSRGSGTENLLPFKVKFPPNTNELRASLTLPKTFPSGTRFKAQLDNKTDKKSVAVVEQTDKAVTVAIPVSELPHGEYALELTAILVDGHEENIPGNYRFDVE